VIGARWLVAAALLWATPVEAGAAHRLRGVLNINTAPAHQLVLLPGVGAKRAAAILKLRARRPFQRTIQLRRVRGIGRRVFERLRPFVRVTGETTLMRFPKP
jgi:competence protein ComEA